MTDRREMDDDGKLEEIVMHDCLAHLEHMDDDEWFLELTRKDGSSVAIRLQYMWDGVVEAFVEERDAPA